MIKIKSSEITPEHIYLSRRKFMTGIGALAASAAVLAACGPAGTSTQTQSSASSGGGGEAGQAPEAQPAEAQPTEAPQAMTDELGDPANSFEAITNYNNYYEFTTDKEAVAGLAQNFTTSP